MPIKIPNQLPAQKILETENIFVMSEARAVSQDIRPLRILLLNLMPTKIDTETQFLRLLGNTPFQVEVDLLQTATHVAKNISPVYLTSFYKTLKDVRSQRYDGMIVTGAPLEHLAYEDVDYWPEFCEILEWAKTNVYSTLHICWGAQAALYYHYHIPKHTVKEKIFGVFEHRMVDVYHPLMRGFDDCFLMPHSRRTEIRRASIEAVDDLVILGTSDLAGVTIVANKSGRQFYLTGHPEYDRMTLANEYFRDCNRGLSPKIPYHYFPGDNPSSTPRMNWRSHANLLFSNWLNYYVYQQTPYDLHTLSSLRGNI